MRAWLFQQDARLGQRDGEAVRRVLAELLERENLPRLPAEPNPFFKWLGELISATGLELDTAVYAFLVVGAISVAIGLWMVFGARSGARQRKAPATLSSISLERTKKRVEELFRQARDAAQSGDYKAALRLYLFALVVGLGEHGDLEFRPAWTNRELVERGRPGPAVRRELLGLLDDLDPKTFGRASAGPGDVERLRDYCEARLGGAPA